MKKKEKQFRVQVEAKAIDVANAIALDDSNRQIKGV